MALSEIKGGSQMLFIKPWESKDALKVNLQPSQQKVEKLSQNLWIWYLCNGRDSAWNLWEIYKVLEKIILSRNTTSLNWMGQREYNMYGGHQALRFLLKEMNLQTDQLQTHAAFPVQRIEPEAQDAVKNPESELY